MFGYAFREPLRKISMAGTQEKGRKGTFPEPIIDIELPEDADAFLTRIYEPTPAQRKGGQTAERVRAKIAKAIGRSTA